MTPLSKFKFGDPGDKFDNLKWDFDEVTDYNTITIGGYPYKVLKRHPVNKQRSIAKKLHNIRSFIADIADGLDDRYDTIPKRLHPKVDLFLDTHLETDDGSGYLISEIPYGTEFEGLNKPKKRYLSKERVIGKDKKLRAGYRDIFLKLDDLTTPGGIENLVIHELAHTAANHCRWRPDDHGKDFQEVEDLIKGVCLSNNVELLK
jgi:hypothetical protein